MKCQILHQYIKTSKHQNLLSVLTWFLESDLGGYVLMKMPHPVTLLIVQKKINKYYKTKNLLKINSLKSSY
jgi:hypothetical protein